MVTPATVASSAMAEVSMARLTVRPEPLSGVWTITSCSPHWPWLSSRGTCSRVSPAAAEHAQRGRLGADQLAGQVGDAHLREPEHLTAGAEQLQHRLAVRPGRADPQAHDHLTAQHPAQVGHHVSVGAGPRPNRP